MHNYEAGIFGCFTMCSTIMMALVYFSLNLTPQSLCKEWR